MKYYTVFLLGLFLVVVSSNDLFAKAFRVGQIPNGSKLGCISCHNSQNGGDSRNPFGKSVGTKYLVDGNVQWGPELSKLDSDGDGFTNGEELQDPNGEWKVGNPAPGNPDLVTNPGDPASKPNVNGISDAIYAMNDPYEINITQNLNFSEINISYNLIKNTYVKLEIIDLNGYSLRFIENTEKSEGRHTNNWDGRNDAGATIPDGVYFIRLSTSENTIIKKFIYNK
jgi:hypothetical protein